MEINMRLTEWEKQLVIAGYINGYEQGHNDTVESNYSDAKESGKDWFDEAIKDGGLEYVVKQLEG